MRSRRLFLAATVLTLAAATAQAAPVALQNAGFEAAFASTTFVGSDGNVTFFYGPSGPDTGWSFGAGTGVANSYNLLTAYEGSRFAFLQIATQPLSQAFTLDQAATVELGFAIALRPNYQPGQTVQVLVDNQAVATVAAGSTQWQATSLSLGQLAAGNHTLGFQGLASFANFGDTTAFLDGVRLDAQVNAVPEPSSSALLAAGLLAMGGLLWRRQGVRRG